MKRGIRGVFYFLAPMGGVVLSSLFLFSTAFADTILLKNDKELKGLVVERHADRIILSTEKGEIPILLSGIKDIRYDDPEQNFMQIGRAYEAEHKYGEALAYYEKAAEVNPNFDEAKAAAAAMKSRFWAATTQGPQSEMEKQNAIYESWGQGKSLDVSPEKEMRKNAKILSQNLGLVIAKKGDWVRVAEAHLKKDAASAGLRRGDRLAAIDGESLRYLNVGVVTLKLTVPADSSFTLEYERDITVRSRTEGKAWKDLGLKLKLEPKGIMVEKVSDDSPAAAAGIKEGDLLTQVNGQSTRYLAIGKVMEAVDSKGAGAVLTVRRSAMLTRK